MNRYEGFGLAFAVLLVASTLAVTPVAAATGDDSGIADESATAEDAWRVSHDVTVYRNGTARVVLTTNRTVEAMQMTKRNVNGLEFHEGEDAVDNQERRVVWDPTVSDRLVYTVELGNARRYGSAVLEKAVLFRTTEILSVRYWRADGAVPAPVRRVAVHAPDGWTEAVPGKKVGPDAYQLRPATTKQDTHLREMVAVGDFEVRTWTAGDDTVRYAAFPTADAPSESDLEELLTASMPVIEEYTGTDPTYPMLAMTVPESVENGGVARDHSFIVQGNSPTFNVETGRSTYVHEFVHLYQRNWGADGSDWISEGMASYYQHLVLREAGLVSPAEFRRMVRVDTTSGGREVGDPVRATAGGSRYQKGEAVYAALDLAVRRDTNGERHVGDVVARFNTQTEDSEKRLYVTKSEFLAAVEAVTGESYETFYANFVESTVYPDVLLSEAYSLSDPPAVDPGPVSRSVLLERNAELRDRVEAQNETITTLRERLDRKNETIASLRENLTRKREQVASLRDRVAAQNETIASLRDRLDTATRSTATGARTATPEAVDPEPEDSGTSSGSGDLRVVGLLGGLGFVFALGVRVGRRD